MPTTVDDEAGVGGPRAARWSEVGQILHGRQSLPSRYKTLVFGR